MYQSTHLAVAVAGVVAVLPGAVAPDEFALVGLVEGLGGGVVIGGTHGSGGGPGSPLGRVVGCRRWTGDLDPRSQWCTSPSRSAPPRSLRAWIACSRALPALSVPRARAGGPADDPAGEQVHDERRATSTPTGSARGRRSTTHLRFGPVAAGVAAQQASGGPVPLGGPGGAHRPARPGAGQSQRPHAPLHGAPGHPGGRPSWALSRRQVFLDPSAALNGSSLRARILPPPRRRRTPTSSRAGGTGRRNRWTGRSCTLTRSGRCRSARPRTPPSGPRCRRRSARWALTLCHRQNSRRAPQDRVGPPPSSRTSFSNSRRRRAPSVVVPGPSPASIRAWRTQPRRVSGLTPSSSPTRLKHPLDRSGSARAPQAPAGSHVA